MKFGVVIFPGSNCDEDMVFALQEIMQQKVVRLWHKDTDLQNVEGIVLPGGFSYGDYLRSGALARFSPIMTEIVKFAKDGGFVFGVCNGFQILCETGLLPGALLHNDNQKFICKNTYIRPDNNDTAISKLLDTSKPLKIPIAHGEGKYFADEKTLIKMHEKGQILFRYSDKKGKINTAANPNGSIENIAGVCNAQKNIFGMMPHPERAVDPDLKNIDGQKIFASILNYYQN